MASADEIVVGPANVYVAPLGTEFPDIDEAPDTGWVLVGTGGDLNYGEEGVTLRKNVTSNRIRTLGSTLTRKVAISEMDFQVEYPVVDLSAEEMALAYGTDPDDITDTAAGAGVAGTKSFALSTDPVPLERAVLVRVGQSASMGRAGNTDWQIARAAFVGTAETTFNKTTGAAVNHIWEAIEPGGSEDAVRFVEQTAAPTE